jgi:hypothetical protein
MASKSALCLSRQHPECLGEDERLVPHRDLALLHGFQERALNLGRGSIDLVGKQDAGHDRARADVKCTGRRPVDLGAREIRRQQVRCELNTPKRQIKRLGQCPNGPSLCQARDALDQNMAAGQESDDQPIQDGPLTDDQVLKSLDQPMQSVLHNQDRGNRERGIVGGHESADPSQTG